MSKLLVKKCTGSKRRKFEKFQIEVEFMDGTKEVQRTGQYDVRNYNQMMKFYKKLKMDYENKDVSCKIRFKGVGEVGKTEPIFCKEIKGTDYSKMKEIKDIEMTDLEKMLSDISNTYRIFLKKQELIKSKSLIVNKKLDEIVHNIEADKYKTVEEKIAIYDEISNLRRIRRKLKQERSALDYMENKEATEFLSLEKLNDSLSWIKKQGLKNKIESENAEIKYKHAPEIFKYKNNKERIRLENKYKNKFDRIVNDAGNMELVCYTNVYKY